MYKKGKKLILNPDPTTSLNADPDPDLGHGGINDISGK
jgi:hypothetical protein